MQTFHTRCLCQNPCFRQGAKPPFPHHIKVSAIVRTISDSFGKGEAKVSDFNPSSGKSSLESSSSHQPWVKSWRHQHHGKAQRASEGSGVSSCRDESKVVKVPKATNVE